MLDFRPKSGVSAIVLDNAQSLQHGPGQGKAFPLLFKKQMFVERPSLRSCNAIACNRSDCYTCFAQKPFRLQHISTICLWY